MNPPIILAAGVNGLPEILNNSKLFNRVIFANSTNELLMRLKNELGGIVSSDIVFFIADNLQSESPEVLSSIISKLTNNNFRVVIVSVTPYGTDLQRQNPRANLLSMPVNLNSVLFALNNFGYNYEPINEGFQNIPLQPVNSPVSHGGWSSPATSERDGNLGQNEKKNVWPAGYTPPAVPDVPVAPNNSTSTGWATALGNVPTNQETAQNVEGFSQNTGNTQRPIDLTPQPSPPRRPLPPSSPPVGIPTSQPRPRTPQPLPQNNSWNVPVNNNPNLAQREGYSSFQNSTGSVDRKGYVITVSVSKGGVGKSSLSLNLAAYLGLSLKKFNKNVCVIDANLQQADSGKYLDTFSPNILDIARDPTLLTLERINEVLVYREEYNMSVLLGPHNPESGNPELITPRRYVEILEILKKKFDYIIIDTPVAEMYHPLFSEFALPKSDYLIVPVAPNFTTLLNADSWLDRVVTAPTHIPGGMGINPNNVGIVLNMAEEDIGCSEEDVRRTLARWQFIGSIPYSKEWKRANNLFELVAPKNYHDISQAFAEILYSATHDQDLARRTYEPSIESKSRGKFGSIFKRGKK